MPRPDSQLQEKSEERQRRRIADLECLVAVPRNVAYIHGLRGTFTAGRAYIDQSLALAAQLENPANLGLSLAVRGWLAILGGDCRRAQADRAWLPRADRRCDWRTEAPSRAPGDAQASRSRSR